MQLTLRYEHLLLVVSGIYGHIWKDGNVLQGLSLGLVELLLVQGRLLQKLMRLTHLLQIVRIYLKLLLLLLYMLLLFMHMIY